MSGWRKVNNRIKTCDSGKERMICVPVLRMTMEIFTLEGIWIWTALSGRRL